MKAFENDAFAKLKAEYELAGTDRSNLPTDLSRKKRQGWIVVV